jgi:formiminoglutamase
VDEIQTAAPSNLFFAGRPGDIRLGAWVKSTNEFPPASKKIETIVIAGCPDDMGVRLNQGRAGAAEGPNSIRKYLYRMTLPMDGAWEEKIRVLDIGNIKTSDDILTTHDRAFRVAKKVAEAGATFIVLGGGHDFAAPNFLGFAEGLHKAKMGLINVDPHLDVRPLENNKPHSGSPFRQILDSNVLKGKNFVEFGTHPGRNAREHFQYCKKKGVRIFPFQGSSMIQSYKTRLQELARTSTVIGATFDMDACCDAEGTSAAPVIGFTAWDLCLAARAAGSQKKVKLFEIAEVAPSLDPTERSSRIAAEMIFSFITAIASLRGL